MLLHVLAHVVAHELVAEVERELFGELGLADAGRAGEQEAAGRAIRLAEAGARSLDRARDRSDRFGLAEHDAAERLLEPLQPILVGRRGLLGRDARHPRDDFFHVLGADLRRFDGAASRALARAVRARPSAASSRPASSIRSMALSGSL